jgi:hypothetical protein
VERNCVDKENGRYNTIHRLKEVSSIFQKRNQKLSIQAQKGNAGQAAFFMKRL